MPIITSTSARRQAAHCFACAALLLAAIALGACGAREHQHPNADEDPIPACEAFLEHSQACLARLNEPGSNRPEELITASRHAIYSAVHDDASRAAAGARCAENLNNSTCK